jgi:hypothetical protein
MSLYSLKIKDTEFKVAVISDPARMKEGLANSNSKRNKRHAV